MTNKVGPSELGKHPDIIKKAQDELMKMDILLCGGCHATFHYVTAFEDHKENCNGSENQLKPDITQSWGFALWKAAQTNNVSNPWKLYQNWVQLDSKTQAAWATAGQSIQTISRIGQGAVQETQVKVVRTVTGPIKVAEADVAPPPAQEPEPEPPVQAEKNQINDAPTPKPVSIAGKRYLMKRTMNSNPSHIEVRECMAEKVTSRRYNNRRSTYEYNVKWVDHDDTWEPANHFERAARELLEDCDRKLAKQKSAAAAAMPAAAPQSLISGRPERSSKARAVSNMRSWFHNEEKLAAAAEKRKNEEGEQAEAENSQDEGVSPKKTIKVEVNGFTTAASAEVVIDSTNDKVSGVRRKPGTPTTPATKGEAQVKLIGKNDPQSSGIVRVGAAQPSPVLTSPGGSRVQKVLQTTRNPSGQLVKRLVYKRISDTSPGTASPAAKTTPARPGVGTTPIKPVQVGKTGGPRTPGVTTPLAANPKLRTPAARPMRPANSPSGRIQGTSPNVSPGSNKNAGGDGNEMVLCPVTGKLVVKNEGDEDDSELQRMLTNEEEAVMQAAAAAAEANGEPNTQIAELIQNEDGTPVMVTGEDGTVYQVAGKNSDGQTLLFTQNEDGEQQCVIMASTEDGAGDGNMGVDEGSLGGDGTQTMAVDGDSQDGQITAELVQADEPSADGTRRVVLLLPDGNLMVSELNEEQYQQFNLGS